MLSLEEVRPAAREDRPDVFWPDEPSPRELYERFADQPGVVNEALGRLLEVRAAEEQITTDVVEAGPTHGLEFRMKSPSSLARKIASKARLRGGESVAEISGRLQDLVRYTAMVDDHDDLVRSARSTIKQLRARGYEVLEVESSYVDGNPYKGLHTVLKAPSGLEFELQVHSRLSQEVKDKLHVDYEIARDDSLPWAQRVEAARRNEVAAGRIPTPPGLDRLKSLGGRPVQQKTYPRMR